jgi:predicted DNA helicase
MEQIHPHIERLNKALEYEEREERNRYKLDQQHTLKSLKSDGLAIHPIKITHKNFGYADYPEFSFRVPFPCDNSQFRGGVAIECFCANEEPIKGILLSLDGKVGEFRLFAPDFPDWIEDEGVGLKRSPDQRTTSVMKQALLDLPQNKKMFDLFLMIHSEKNESKKEERNPNTNLMFFNSSLNESQCQAVQAVVDNKQLTILHGPPGTGKTTTLIEAIRQLVKEGKKIIVSAPSNTAVDNIAKGLLKCGVKLLRVGNTTKVDDDLQAFTPEGSLSDKKIQKELKELKKRAEEFRKMALQYKRRFGKSEREQRSLLFKEVKNIRTEIKKTLAYHEDKLYENAQVILGTPIGLMDSHLSKIQFDTLVIDEAAQCLEPLAWCVFPLAERIVLAGDPFQLPPTVLSREAEKLGLNQSILEACFNQISTVYLLNTQYRMRTSIAGFSNDYFYEGQLQTPHTLQNNATHITFMDTAGAGMEEQQGALGFSLQNEGELQAILKMIKMDKLTTSDIAFISPYSGQVSLAKETLSKNIRISTIDSFQGQEYHTVIVSLVRSNDDGQIGFLADVRRMNVALTRAKERLYVIGDSATLGKHAFYQSFLDYVALHGEHRTVWELEFD